VVLTIKHRGLTLVEASWSWNIEPICSHPQRGTAHPIYSIYGIFTINSHHLPCFWKSSTGSLSSLSSSPSPSSSSLPSSSSSSSSSFSSLSSLF
jgi:hypothetical protein